MQNRSERRDMTSRNCALTRQSPKRGPSTECMDQLLLRMDVELLIDRMEVIAHGARAQEQRLRNRRDSVTGDQPADALQLPGGQPGEAGQLPLARGCGEMAREGYGTGVPHKPGHPVLHIGRGPGRGLRVGTGEQREPAAWRRAQRPENRFEQNWIALL